MHWTSALAPLIVFTSVVSAAPHAHPGFKDDIRKLFAVASIQAHKPAVTPAPFKSVILPRDDSSACDFTSHAEAAAQKLNSKFNQSSGIWDSLWWESANCLYSLADLAVVVPSTKDAYAETFKNSFIYAQKQSLSQNHKDPNLLSATDPVAIAGGFTNSYYDDSSWWGLAWLKAYDATGNVEYLDAAEKIFDFITTGWDDTCGGGVWWSTDKTYKNAITNELFLTLSASLANRVPGNKTYYVDWAQKEWAWFQNSGLINGDNLINDGLDNSTCKNNGQNVWSYNMGVVLGGLTELNQAVGSGYLDTATTLAKAAVTHFDKDGVITEGCEKSGCDGSSEFKGIFIRYLGDLVKVISDSDLRKFVVQQGVFLYDTDNSGNTYSISWNGPPDGDLDPAAQSSALEALVQAIKLGGCNSGDADITISGSASSSSTLASSAPSSSVHASSTSSLVSSISSTFSSHSHTSTSTTSSTPIATGDSSSSVKIYTVTAAPSTVAVHTITSIEATVISTVTAPVVTLNAVGANNDIETGEGELDSKTSATSPEIHDNLVIVTQTKTAPTSFHTVWQKEATINYKTFYTTAYAPVQTVYA